MKDRGRRKRRREEEKKRKRKRKIICIASVSTSRMELHWEQIVVLFYIITYLYIYIFDPFIIYGVIPPPKKFREYKVRKRKIKAMSMMSIESVCVIPSVTPGILIFLRCQFNIYLILLLIKQITF